MVQWEAGVRYRWRMFTCNFTASILGLWFDSNPGHSFLFALVPFSSQFPLCRLDDSDFTLSLSCFSPYVVEFPDHSTSLHFTSLHFTSLHFTFHT